MMPGSGAGFPAAAGIRVVAMAVLFCAWVPPTGAQIKPPALPALKVPAIKPPAEREPPAHKVPAIKPPAERATAIIIPRENCGTFWTDWERDPNAKVNPCPANCERGERLDLKESKSDGKPQYQANYRCYLPELAIQQPASVAKEPGMPPRTNCGTFWTARQSEPSTDANPCPAHCERGELLDARRGRSGDKLFFELNYRCYLARDGDIKMKKRTRRVTTPVMALAGSGPPAGVDVPAMRIAGAGPTASVAVREMALVGAGPTPTVQVPAMTLVGAEAGGK